MFVFEGDDDDGGGGGGEEDGFWKSGEGLSGVDDS